MTIGEIPSNRLVRANARKLWIGALIILVAALICGAISFAFLFESPSIKYKFGWDKVLLRTGKIVGLTAAVLLLLQLPIAGRIKLLDRIFSLPGLYRIHRFNAYLIGMLVVLHPVLVFLPEGRLMIPFETRYWPEWVGAGLLVIVLIQIILSRWRTTWIQRYGKWLFVHRFFGMAALALLVVHVLYVSETFEYEGLPRNTVIIVAIAIAVLWVAIRGQRLQAKRRPFLISSIEPAGKDAYSINLEPVGPQGFQYFSGQFAFFSFVSGQLSTEWHPFTLSSSPTRPAGLQVTIRCSGDWTHRINTVQKGERVYVHGPFGRFSHRYEPADREVIMIAGGIGITPMLSMLREMSDKEDPRRITLFWSNQTLQHLFNHSELSAFEQKLTRFSWIPIFTRNQEPVGEFGRLTRDKLEILLAERPRNASIFLCGPPKMTLQIHKDLIAIGFSAQSIQEERFGL